MQARFDRGSPKLTSSLHAVRRSRIVLFVGALLVFCAAAPAAAAPGASSVARAVDHWSASSERSAGDEAAPQLVAAPLPQRAVSVAAGAQRRAGDSGLKVLLLGGFAVLLAMRTAAGRVDAEANARLLRVSNTPCARRGPPLAA
jgi:hypothetical protein